MDRETASQDLQSELNSGESIAWVGQPSNKVVFRSQDLMMIPFSLLWGGFAIFWEAGILGFVQFGHTKAGAHAPLIMAVWGVPFVLIGQYLIWGRFFHVAWKKGRMYYAVTNKRVLVVSKAPNRRVISAFLEQLPAIDKTVRGDGIGTLTFGLVPVVIGRRSSQTSWDGGLSSTVPKFVDIEDAENVYRIISDAREKSLRKE